MSNRQATARLAAAVVRAARPTLELETLEPRALISGTPTARLVAKAQSVWSPSYTFKVIYSDDQAVKLSTIDSNDISVTGSNGYSRKARLVGATSDDKGKTVTARYKIATPGTLWDSSDNGIYTFKLLSKQVTDTRGTSVARGVLGTITANVPAYPSDAGQQPDVPPGAVDVRNFGAIANDNVDDTDAIQRAIDSLPRVTGVPDASVATGGIVFIPAGTWNVSRPLKVSSGATLEGQGATTVLKSSSKDGSAGVVQFVSYWTHAYMVDASIKDLSILTASAKGISADAGTVSQMVGVELRGLTISAGGAAIDFRGVDVYRTTLRDITVNDPGSTAIWMEVGHTGGNTAVNRISNVSVQGTARAGFKAERAMISIGGDFNVDALSIADTGAKVTPLYVSGTASFSNLSLQTPSSNLPGSVLVNVENSGYVSFDALDNLGESRSVRVTSSWDVQVATLNLAGGATLAEAANVDGGSHLSVGTLLGGATGAVNRSRVRLGPAAPETAGPGKASPLQRGAAAATDIAGPVSTLQVSVTNFGARSDDGVDDTAAIQAAIDSLPRGAGLPGSGKAVGGMIVLSRGVYNTSAPLRVPSGVWLLGQGDATVIRNGSFDGTSAAVLLVSGASSGTNAGAGVSDLSIRTESAAAIRADASISNALIDLHLSGLTLNAGGASIDLRAVKTYHASIEQIGITNPGSTALWIGDDLGYSADNRVSGVQMFGATRSNFRAERALFVFQGQNQIQNVWTEGVEADVLPLYISGNADLRGVWLEHPYEHTIDRTVAFFDNTTNVTIDRMFSIDDLRHVRFRKSPNVNIGSLMIFGRDIPLANAMDLDATSHVNIGTVAAMRDSGMLDSAQVSVQGTYNLTAKTYLDTNTVLSGRNLLEDMQGRTVQWGDSLGQVFGTQTIEQTANGPRLRIEITSNPNNRPVSVTAGINVGAGDAGKSAAARYRIDGSGTAVVYTSGFAQQYSSRVMNSLTVVPVPLPLKGGEQMVVMLPPMTGVFYLSDFGVVTS